ncbi:zinc ribbon domain-containing protein [Acrocarpospora sp. B8E8]|uniref:zinc ribbon domain-containing protein n=1 Tax=Acrocarpospora sp. B8E8 TaxID=3153572 RepID=UPI00325EC4D3
MATSKDGDEAGRARYGYRLRVSSTALSKLLGEWDRCRWVWNQCVAESRAAHKAKQECGPARLDKMLTGRRAEHQWLPDAAIGATKTALVEMARKHGRTVHLVHPAHTTMDCGHCGARTKHALPLSERKYTCTACGAVSSRDKNSARVMLVRAGLAPAGVDRVRPGRPQGDRAA